MSRETPVANAVVIELARRLKQGLRSRKVRLALYGLALVLVTALVVYRFSPKQEVLGCAFRISSSGTPETKGDSFKVDTCLSLELLSTNSERTLGLSGRRTMDQNKGMLFDFKQPAEYCMWMKDMHFALDMIWLDEQKEIVYMIEGVTPETYPKAFCGPASARYVVEVNQGVVKAGDLHVGQRLRF